MNFKRFLIKVSENAIGFLAGFLLFHYRGQIVHGIAYGIPWNSKYFWPIGHDVWVLLIMLAVGGACWAGLYWWNNIDSIFLGVATLFVGAIFPMLAAIISFKLGYIVFGLINTAMFLVNMWTAITEGDRPAAINN